MATSARGLAGTSPAPIRFSSALLRPESGAAWSFLLVPKAASARLRSRGRVAVDGTMNGAAFSAVLEPDGLGSHWLKVSAKLRESAGASTGDSVAVEIVPAAMPEPRVPADVRSALAGDAKARAVWSDITPAARADWLHWIVTAKTAETRARRIRNACSMLAGGKRRVCCFDRSGMASRAFGAPVAARVPGRTR